MCASWMWEVSELGTLISMSASAPSFPLDEPVIAIVRTPIDLAFANDFGFDGVFERQVEALGREGDVLVGISTSGNSENVVRAFARARSAGLRTIALTGGSSGKLGALADIEINVPSSETSHIQEAHIAVGQLIAFLVEDELFPL